MPCPAVRSALLALLCALALLAAAPAVARPVTASSPPLIGTSGPDQGTPTALANTNGYRFEQIGFATVLWANGRGDVTLDLELTNLGIADWRSLSWSFGWSSGDYSQIRAWDERGPLAIDTARQGSTIVLTPRFRTPVPVGARYRLGMAITIGGMAGGAGNDWRASWTTRSGSPVGSYVERLTLPSNATVRSVAPTPASRQANTLEWRTASPTSDWSFGFDVAYTLSDRIAAPLFLQRDLPWGPKAYGSYRDDDAVNTVGLWGCYMTAAAIVARYHADQQGAAPQIDPGDLNAWLRANKRYDRNNFNPLALPDYAAARGVTLRLGRVLTGGRTAANDRALDDYLRSGNPVILKVPAPASPSGIHFVVAVGRTTTAEGAPTYDVLDPYHGATTLAARYSNSYTSIIPFTGADADARALSFSGHSPIELLVTDPLGRRSGIDPRTGQRFDEIPGAVYSSDAVAPAAGEGSAPGEPVKNLTIAAPLDGPYTVEVLGTGDGPFSLITMSADWRGRTTTHTQVGQAAPGSALSAPTVYAAVGGLYQHTSFLPLMRR
jgi:hypothetical protein